jgi:uncharacterized protein YndB with AHSA1/START domain
MGIALLPPTASVDRRIAAPSAAVWRLLADVEEWPRWGPSVRGAQLESGGSELTAGAQGTVRTALGVTLPFTITDFDPGRRWGWTVAGLPGTGHQVTDVPGGCRVRFEVPWWAVAYLPVCAVALARIEKLVSP